MATTSPDNIWYPTASDQIAPLETSFATQASSVQAALTGSRAIKSYRWANAAARTAQKGMAKNDQGYQTDTDTLYTYNGSAWVAYDTGWLAIPNQSGNYSFDNNAAYRKIGNVVYLRGQITKKNGGTLVNTDGMFSMTAGNRPANTMYFSPASNPGVMVRLSLSSSDGKMSVAGPPAGAASYAMLDGICYIADN